MIVLVAIAAVTLLATCAQPWLAKVGERRLEQERLELQALHAQIRSESLAEAYYR